MRIAAVIVTYNSQHVIGRCLDACIGQGLSEIIVVDNGSDDRTPDSGFLVFDEFVRYRQLTTEPVAIGELLRRFSGTAGRDRVLGR